ncbi:MAG: hypothetical protein J6Y24_05125 [Bacteroidales bacterium]|nr:hypothetical protein [Bacteroidales bacterium]
MEDDSFFEYCKPNKTYTESIEREELSVDFVSRLVKGRSARPELKCCDKEPDIDGYIHLLDDEGCIVGKLTVQVKTVSPCDEGKNKYPCPASLLAYAFRTLDVVILLAVDHKQKVILWKHITKSMVKEYHPKVGQKTITLHFDENERLSIHNVPETIKKWKSLYCHKNALMKESEVIKAENETLRRKLLTAECTSFTISKEDVTKIQRFSDLYNRFLDADFNYVKRIIYSDTWKMGIAISDYKDTDLCYVIYSIKYGENSLLIKQLPKDSINSIHYNIAYFGDNLIKNDIFSLVKGRIADDIKYMFKYFRIIPPYDHYVVEYIRNYVKSKHLTLGIDSTITNDYSALKNVIEQRFKINGKVVNSSKVGDIDILYDSIVFLLNRGYVGDAEIYPSFGDYGNSGYVSDFYTPELAFEKTKKVFGYVYETYCHFIRNNFPLICHDLDMYYKADYVLINLDYDVALPQLSIFYFYRIDNYNGYSKTIVEYSLNKKHELFYNNPNQAQKAFMIDTVIYNGIFYECRRCEGLNRSIFLFGEMCLIDSFYEIFKKRLEEYVNKILFVVDRQ